MVDKNEPMDKNDPKYFETYQWDVPDDETTADWIDGTHTGCGDKEIPRLVALVRAGQIPEEIMKGLRVLALNTHNRFVKYNMQRHRRIRASSNTDDLRRSLIENLNDIIEIQGRTTQILRNIRDDIAGFWIDKPYEHEDE